MTDRTRKLHISSIMYRNFTLIELLVNTSQHNCFSLLLKSPQLP